MNSFKIYFNILFLDKLPSDLGNLSIKFFILSFFNIFLDLVGVLLIALIINIILRKNLNILYFDLNEINKYNLIIYIIIISVIRLFFTIIVQRMIFYYAEVILKKISEFILASYLDEKLNDFDRLSLAERHRNLYSELPIIQSTLSNISNIIIDLSVIFFIGLIIFYNQGYFILWLIFIFSFVSISFTKLSSKFLKKFGEFRFLNEQKKSKLILDSINSFREIKLYDVSHLILNLFSYYTEKIRDISTKIHLVESSGKYIYDFLLLMILVLFSLFSKSLSNIDLGIIIAAAYRILPSFNRVTSSYSSLNSSQYKLNNIFNELKNAQIFSEKIKIKSNTKKINYIQINNLSFKYKISDYKFIFNDFNYKINQGDIVLISGKSGAGKSTLLDIITGLLQPNSGIVNFIDSSFEIISPNNLKIGYVTQNPIIFNGTVLDNILFGRPFNQIKYDLVNEYLLHVGLEKLCSPNFIINDGGTNLSGGQIKRLAVARAIYDHPNIIILDETTTSLDSNTENLLFEFIKKLNIDIVIYISHKENSKIFCTKEINLDNL